MGNLTNLGRLAMFYAEDHQQRFPIAEGAQPRAHESLQKLVYTMPTGGEGHTDMSKVFVCPGSAEAQAERGIDGLFHLTEKNVSYAWRARPLRMGEPGEDKIVLACDKSLEHHNGTGACVLYSDCRVKFVPAAELGEGGLDGFITRNELSR